jgi:FPC/CPF motif-containing protein YcgG
MNLKTRDCLQDIKDHLLRPNYPCIAAVSSFLKGDFLLREYKNFGAGECAASFAEDLLHFKSEQKRLNSDYYSFWAAFPDSTTTSESQFEELLWNELSALHHYEYNKNGTLPKADPKFSSRPSDKNFCFSLGGSAFFVVGMHPLSSRKARDFPYPVLVFNLYDQFQKLISLGTFDSMVQVNRKREMLFEGSLNPMVIKYAQDYETIQFSGKYNHDEWKCPFKSLL